MSIVVKGMEMPKKCLWCPLQYIGFCQVTKTDVNSDLGRRADDCPLVSVSEPHGEWLRMSDLSEKDDNRYKCSRCGNVIHHKSRMDLYTFNSWCGKCGSDNSRHTEAEGE